MPDFGKWWDDPKKHRKRVDHWLPHWRSLAAQIGDDRQIRYFTFCARHMIDVFMLIQENILRFDEENYSIPHMQFCECDQEQFDEIKDLVAREDAGFFGYFEKILLFRDDDFTAGYPTEASIDVALEDENLQADDEKFAKLKLKRTFFNVRASFPYDFVNLDFCDYYYPEPPGMLRINQAVEQVLEWQKLVSQDAAAVEVNEFILTVTCRHDAAFPQVAEQRLIQLMKDNCATSDEYRVEFENSRGTADVEAWAAGHKEEFFLSGWPKDIARSARDRGWKPEIVDYVYYRREDGDGTPYVIACLVMKFSKSSQQPNYIPAALYALRPDNHKVISDLDPNSTEGKAIMANLIAIIKLRNEQAQRKNATELPLPEAA